MNARSLMLGTLGILVTIGTLRADDWMTAPSYFTHSPATGQRVNQYAPVGPFYIYQQGDFVRSGYRQSRSSLQVGNSVDHMHVVEEWGRPVRPYEEWRFPMRPYSAPYPAWGPQPGFYPGYFGGFGGPFPNNPNFVPGNGGVGPFNAPTQPWFDGNYPNAPRTPPRFEVNPNF